MINILSNPNTTKQAPTFILQSSFLNNNASDSLLHKRYESSQLGDLLTKKVKTGSTTISESTSCQGSPTLRKNKSNFSEDSMNEEKALESVKQIMSKGRATPTSPTSASSYSLSQEDLSSSPSRNDFSRRPIDEEYCQLQLALEILQRKLNLYQEIPPLRETVSEMPFNQEPLYIPPLVASTSEPVKVCSKETKEIKQNKKRSKKEKDDENDLQISYGTVEFPFLSLSTPMPQENPLEFSQLLNIPALFLQQSRETEEIKGSVSPLEKASKGGKAQVPEVAQKPLAVTKEEPKKIEVESEKVAKEQLEGKKAVKVIGNLKERGMVFEKVQKKSKEVQKEQDRDSDREKEKAKKIKQECDELYARPTYFARRQTERRKNKWQIEQEEKFKGIQFQPPLMKESSDIFFGGIKKKSAITPVGPEYQVDVAMVMVQKKDAPLRKPKMKWSPACHDQSKLAKFFGSVKKLFNMNVSEEGIVDVIINNNNDLNKALEYLKANKAECRKMLSIKPVIERFEE